MSSQLTRIDGYGYAYMLKVNLSCGTTPTFDIFFMIQVAIISIFSQLCIYIYIYIYIFGIAHKFSTSFTSWVKQFHI